MRHIQLIIRVLKGGITKKYVSSEPGEINLNPPEPGTVAFRKPEKRNNAVLEKKKPKGDGEGEGEDSMKEGTVKESGKRKAEAGTTTAKKAKSNPKLLSFETED